MEFNNKKLEKTSRLINYLIAIVLCGFLISLSGKLIHDIESWKERPTIKQFQDTQFLESKKLTIENINEKIKLKYEKKRNVDNTIKVVANNYTNAKQSFDNWLKARKTIGSPKEDKEILLRANKLDEYYQTEQKWRKERTIITNDILTLNKNKDEILKIIKKEKERAYEEQKKAIRKYELKIFLIRLLFILPILLLGIFFILKFRKHKYWPLFLGFVLFSFYVFFFGLVPYLPIYGGYVRYAVGIVVSILLGIYAINKIKTFIEHKKNELKTSTTERAKKVQSDTAEKALDNHMCPSCGKDFISKRWDKPSNKKNINEGLGIVTNFCRFCGLELFKKCNICNSNNFAHLPFCSNCGDKITGEK